MEGTMKYQVTKEVATRMWECRKINAERIRRYMNLERFTVIELRDKVNKIIVDELGMKPVSVTHMREILAGCQDYHNTPTTIKVKIAREYKIIVAVLGYNYSTFFDARKTPEKYVPKAKPEAPQPAYNILDRVIANSVQTEELILKLSVPKVLIQIATKQGIPLREFIEQRIRG